MVAHTFTIALSGIKCLSINVQVMLTSGMPSFTIVGLPSKTVGESRDRIKAAIIALGIKLPPKKIVVNLSPADILKTGSHYDLPIALGLLVEIGIIKQKTLNKVIAIGELSLDGSIISTSGVLPAAIKAKELNFNIICSKNNINEVLWAIKDNKFIAADTLFEVIDALNNSIPTPTIKKQLLKKNITKYNDISEIHGQNIAIKALKIAVAGKHNILMIGAPGIGKSMLASMTPGIMPELTNEEILENNLILSITGELKNGALHVDPPFRSPHHTTSVQAMIGGGRMAKLGEVTMAHNGILFLDEFPEFSIAAINSLRQPLETKMVTITRVEAQAIYPADFMLIAAMNPCKCGYLYDKKKKCSKAPKCALNYINKIHGPILDRIDMCVILDQPPPISLSKNKRLKESSKCIRNNIIKARQLQLNRYSNMPHKYNAMVTKNIEQTICINEQESSDIEQFINKCDVSIRGYHKILRVARSIADIEESDDVHLVHIKEAFSYRMNIDMLIK
ncbi:magnesium chelatase family protein [Candidatus Xenohaliotis californiensis]|uniref:Magnesium chelatase family protein n=1 Tax=Candidatus Xenohaliotis californiensis TaxID=84677 RepID=A0ABP0EYG3_9RICK|nr:magnesium chelatase family protein [Candidatus Xenohaliotis californiensis]